MSTPDKILVGFSASDPGYLHEEADVYLPENGKNIPGLSEYVRLTPELRALMEAAKMCQSGGKGGGAVWNAALKFAREQEPR